MASARVLDFVEQITKTVTETADYEAAITASRAQLDEFIRNGPTEVSKFAKGLHSVRKRLERDSQFEGDEIRVRDNILGILDRALKQFEV